MAVRIVRDSEVRTALADGRQQEKSRTWALELVEDIREFARMSNAQRTQMDGPTHGHYLLDLLSDLESALSDWPDPVTLHDLEGV